MRTKRMKNVKSSFSLLVFLLSVSCVVNLSQAQIRVAVASNFANTAQELSHAFSEQGNVEPILLIGSTGKHAAQIARGLPVDLFMAADQQRPQYIESIGLAVDNSRVTYAIGRLAFWVPGGSKKPKSTLRVLLSQHKKIALANPKLAPYGLASEQSIEYVMAQGEATTKREPERLMGENIGQTFQFLNTGNVEAGFIAFSQVEGIPDDQLVLVPSNHHDPIEQQMLILRESQDVRGFYEFVLSELGKTIIRNNGYETR